MRIHCKNFLRGSSYVDVSLFFLQSNKKSLEDRRDTPSPRHASTASPSGLGKNTDPKVISNYSDMNGRVSSPLCSSAAHCTSPSPAVRNNVLINKKLAEATSDPTVIDLTDKDDKGG